MSSVDVVVPCYNYARFLPRCVGSILSQAEVDVRVLIIDDTSTDDTPEVGRRLAEMDPRVEFRRHEQNRGHIATYNEGLLEWASAKYSMLISADDVLAPGSLARATRLMDSHDEVGMAYGMALIMIDEEEPDFQVNDQPSDVRVLSGAEFLSFCFGNTFNPVPTPAVVVRTEVQQRIGGYEPKYPHAGDLDMWLRFACEGSIGVVKAVQAYYRWHSTNMSHQYYEQQFGDRREFLEVCDKILARAEGKFAQVEAWRRSISGCVGAEALASASTAFNEGRVEDCAAWLKFIDDACPSVRGSSAWWRLAAKRLLGRRSWQAWNRWRGHSDWRGLTMQPSRDPVQGQQFGWWPG